MVPLEQHRGDISTSPEPASPRLLATERRQRGANTSARRQIESDTCVCRLVFVVTL